MNRVSWATLLDVFGSKCLACGATDRLEADHVIPVAKGGDNDPLNFQPLCRTCNASKGAMHIDYRTPTQVEKLKRAIVHAMHPAVKIVEV
jgi:5-methylcytosine-specific restriction endonuclease McrA